MQKKLIAAAVAGALGMPAVALAQNATVNIYGRIYMEYGFVNQGQASTPGTLTGTIDRVQADLIQAPGSMIGFRGEEKLGGGLSAWFQCESSADFRGQNGDGFCTRNSALGLKGNFGSLFVGNWQTPFTLARITTGSNETGVFGTAALLTGHSTTVGDSTGPQLFARRQMNSVNYHSPNFGGFSFRASTTAANSATARSSTDANAKPRLYSVAGQYANGPLQITAAYEQHNSIHGTGAAAAAAPFAAVAAIAAGGFSGDESAWLVGGAYTFGGKFKLGGMYTRQKWDTVGGVGVFAVPAGAVGESSVNAWQLGFEWAVAGPHSIKGAYTRASDVTGSGAAATGGLRPAAGGGTVAGGSTGAKMYQARYFYALSKRTDFSIGMNHVKNDTYGGYNINGVGANGGAGSATAGVGAKHTGYAFALDHRF